VPSAPAKVNCFDIAFLRLFSYRILYLIRDLTLEIASVDNRQRADEKFHQFAKNPLERKNYR